MLDENFAWTTDLGQAFLNQPADVMDSVQRLRAQAQAMGNLLSTPQQTVVVDGGIIEIVPTAPQVIYVPVYQPEVVYVQSPPAPGRFYVSFGAGLVVGAWLNHDCDWRAHEVIVWHQDHLRPADWWYHPANRREASRVVNNVTVVNHTTVVNQNFTVWRPCPSGVARGKHRQAAGGQGTCPGDRAASQWPTSFRPSSGASTAAESAHSCAERYSSCCCAGCPEAVFRGYQRSAACRSAGDSTSGGDCALTRRPHLVHNDNCCRGLTGFRISRNLWCMPNKTNAPETAEHSGKIEVKEAVRKCVAYFHKLYPNFGTDANVMIEEVEESDDGAYWLVTLGYDIQRRVSRVAGNLQDVFGPQVARHYKVFKVNAETGRIVSMKIRSLG
jgi:hypothetical protein